MVLANPIHTWSLVSMVDTCFPAGRLQYTARTATTRSMDSRNKAYRTFSASLFGLTPHPKRQNCSVKSCPFLHPQKSTCDAVARDLPYAEKPQDVVDAIGMEVLGHALQPSPPPVAYK